MSFFTPLRYPGGKGQLASWLAKVLSHNGLTGGTYVEPYAGGCGAALQLLLTNQVGRIIINDADPAIYAFWWTVLNDSERLRERIQTTEVSVSQWEMQRSVLSSPGAHSIADLGFAAFFVNRTSRSGILTGGVIGGKKQIGNYKIDARFNRLELAGRVHAIAARKADIELHGLDAMDLIAAIKKRLQKFSLIYFDPPYYAKGAQLYRNHYGPGDHQSIASAITKLRTPWLLTYDDCEPIRSIYRGNEGLAYSPYYSTHSSRAHASEVMYYGNLCIPEAPFLKRASPAPFERSKQLSQPA